MKDQVVVRRPSIVNRLLLPVLLVTCHLSLVTTLGCGAAKGGKGEKGGEASSGGQAGQALQTKTDVVEGAVTGVAFDPSVAVGDTGAVRGVATASAVRGIDLGGAEQGVRGGVRGGVRASSERATSHEPRATLRRQDGGEAPVTGARVRIDGTSFETVTNEKGEFKIPYIPAGNYTIVGEKQGESGEVYAFSQSTSVAAGGEVDLGSLSLAETGAISGIVKRTDATSHLGTDVFIPGTSFAAKTDDDGNFKIFYIPKGTYSLAAMFPAFETLRLKDIQVKSKETTKVTDATLKRAAADKAKAGMIFGRVTAAGGGAVRDAVVTTIPESQTARSDTAGNFAISNVSPGVYLVKASRGGFSDNSKFVDIQESLFGQIEIRLAPNAQVMTAGADAAEKAGAAPSVSVEAPPTAAPGATVHLVASVTDPDSENIDLKWKANGGALSSTFAPEVDWTAPSSNGIFIIELTVTDGILSERATVAISVSASGQAITIDTTPPFPPRPDKLTVKANPPGAEDEISGAAGCVEPGATVKFYADGLLRTALGSATANAEGVFGPIKIGDNKGDSNDQIFIAVYDAAGNLGIPYFVVNDKTPSDTILTKAVCSVSVVICQTNSATANFEFSAGETGAKFECSIDSPDKFATCSSPNAISNLSDGSHTFYVRAVDAAGNVDVTPGTSTWTVDLTPPDTAISSPPVSPTKSTSASFSFTSPDSTAKFECSLDGAPYKACTSPASSSALTEGNHTFAVRAVDPSGNPDTTPATFTWTIDLTAPDTAIGAKPTNPTSSTTASFSFTSPDTSARFDCSLDSAAYGSCSSPHPLTSLTDGSHTMSIRAVDRADNADPTPANYTWVVDTTAPAAGTLSALNTSYGGTYVDATFDLSVSFTDGTGSGVTACQSCKSTDGVCDFEWVAATFAGGTCSLTGLTCTDGQSLTLSLRATDNAGNTGQAPPISRTCDAAAPTASSLVTLSNGFTATHVDGNYDITTNFSDASGSGLASCQYCQATDGTCDSEWTAANLFSGSCTKTGVACTNGQSLTINMRATDNVGSVGTAIALSRTCDTAAPVIGTVTVLNTATATHVDSPFDVSASLTDAAGVASCQYTTDNGTTWTAGTVGANCTASPTCTNGGALNINIRATDQFGVVGTGTAIPRTCDTVAPTTTDNAAAAWQSANQTVTLTPTDGGSGMVGGSATTLYCVDTTNTCTPAIAGTSVSVTCTASTTCQQYARFFSRDAVGNQETTVSKLVRIDKQVPTTTGSISPTPYSASASCTGNGCIGTTFSVSATFSDPAAGSGITACDYCEATASQVGGACIPGWIAAAFSAGTCSVSARTCVNGTQYYLKMRASDGVANGPTEFAQLNYECDAADPSVVTVKDGTGNDADHQTRLDKLDFNWTAAADGTGSGIHPTQAYTYAIGLSNCAGASPNSVVNWANNGIATSKALTGLALTAWNTYYVNIRSYDGVGRFSCSSSDGFLVVAQDIQTAFNPGKGNGQSLVLDTAGRAHISHGVYDSATTDYNLAYAENVGGAAWTSIDIDTTSKRGQYNAIVSNSGGYHIVYYDSTTGDLMYATCAGSCNLPGSWTVGTLVDGNTGVAASCSTTANVGQYPSLATVGTTLYATYYDVTNTALKYATCSTTPCTTSANWACVTLDNATSTNTGQYSAIAVTGAGLHHVAYYDSVNFNLLYAQCGATCTSAVNWTVGVVVDSLNTVGQVPHIGLKSTGAVVVKYYYTDGNPTYSLKVGTCPGTCTTPGNWALATAYTCPDPCSSSSMAVGANDKVYVVAHTISGGYKMIYATDASGSWVGTLVSEVDTGVYNQYLSPSVALEGGASPVVHVSYDTGTDFRYFVKP